MDSDGGNDRKLAEGGYPHWSADGKTLYFHSRTLKKIRAVDVSRRESVVRDVLDMPFHYYPAVSPDGRHVAYYRTPGRLVVASLPAGDVVKDVPLEGWNGLLPRWSRDSRFLGFGSFGGSNVVGLWILDLETGKFRQVAPFPCTNPAWSNDGDKFSFDNRTLRLASVWTISTDALETREVFDQPIPQN